MSLPDILRDPRIRWDNIVPLDVEIVPAPAILAHPKVTIDWNKRSLAEVWGVGHLFPPPKRDDEPF
jgi:hypothetical protein